MALNQAAIHAAGACPEQVALARAVQKADLVRGNLAAVPREQRGATDFINLTVDDLPTSASLMTDGGRDTSTLFDNVLEARKFRERLLEQKDDVDQTIPRSADELKAHVKVLFKAFKCVPRDNGESEATKKPFISEIHENGRVESLCWDILQNCIHRSEVTMNLVEAYEPGKYKLKKCMEKSFAQRFDLVVEGMASSKSMCKHMFDAPYMTKVIDDPQTNTERIDSNRKLNGQKAIVMKRGKEAVAHDEQTKKKQKTAHSTEEEQDDTEVQHHSPVTTPAPRTRQRPATASRASAASSQMYTPPPRRTHFQNQQPQNSAPSRMPQMQPNFGTQTQLSAPAPLNAYGNSTYNMSPTPSNSLENVVPRQFLRMNHPSYPAAGYDHPTYTDYGSPAFQAPPPPYGTQFQQMQPQAYAPTSRVRTNQTQLASSPSAYATSQHHSQYIQVDPVLLQTPASSNWLGNPQPETPASNSGYSDGETATASPEYSVAASQNRSPDAKPPTIESLTNSASNTNTLTRDDDDDDEYFAGIGAQHEDTGTQHEDLQEMLAAAEANAQEEGFNNKYTSDGDAAFESD